MKNNQTNELTVGEIVASDFRAASVLSEAGIDFCCGGNKTLGESCAEKGIPVDEIEKKLETVRNSGGNAPNFKDWDLDFLSDYIKNSHHKYVLKTLPELLFYIDKIARVHGDRHPELVDVASLFSKLNNELLIHLKQEEEVLFPAIKEVISQNSEAAKATIKSEINRMSGEHEFAGGTMDTINRITHQYNVPSDGCNTYHVTFRLLKQFEDDLHIHVHLENNILFPKAIALTKS